MSKVLVLVPFPMSDENLQQRKDQVNAVELGPDIQFDFESVLVAPKNYVSQYDLVLADVGMLEAGLNAQERGYDAVCIDTMSDSGVAALRSVLDIPVIGPGRASMLIAMLLGNRFSIVTMWQHWVHLYEKTIKDLDFSKHCASVRSVDVRPDNIGLLGGKEDEIFPLLEEAARSCIEEDGADVILLGSTTMHQAHGYLAARLPVPVINPGPLSYKMAEMLLGTGLSHSRKAWPKSPAPRDDVLHAMLERGSEFDHQAFLKTQDPQE
ncbi:MAG: hydrogenase expression protein HupH [Alphaproteobacteria bacterium]|jgi:allantoin racemase|nr:hydrogenase expression protein HupH [Alphaproteobacteria bacterium]MBT4084198.1 hydrogenase expression protein HupH [Alphaproteobacteria bacterium]MBT4544871.1 hydrogenase expression protein HupH [Alphaproteobacteria bacterium]MBT7746603.1 hydrogenase expression protein HupH [Alphaproteobacteria bacterium]